MRTSVVLLNTNVLAHHFRGEYPFIVHDRSPRVIVVTGEVFRRQKDVNAGKSKCLGGVDLLEASMCPLRHDQRQVQLTLTVRNIVAILSFP